ncbi:MAG: MAPEG family protein [Polyangiaceae bacterium]
MTIPFWCLAIAFLLVYAVKIPVAIAMFKVGGGKYDNDHPRDQQAKLQGWGRRANAAHQNAFEGFAPFAAAVFVAHLGGGSPHTASLLAIAYVSARFVYNGLYIGNISTLRSAVWGIGFASTLGLFLLPVL